MPFLYHGNNKLWSHISSAIAFCRRKLSRSSNKTKNRNIGTDTVTTEAATRDWRSLSPYDPPLPFVPDAPCAAISTIVGHPQSSEQAPKRNSPRQVPDEGNLSTIIEESDLRTELSPSPRSSAGHYWSFYQHQEEETRHTPAASMPSNLNNSNNVTHPQPTPPVLMPSNLNNSNDVTHPQPTPKASSSRTSSLSSSSSKSSSSTHSFQPPPAWPIHPKTERRWSSSLASLPTSEKKAKRTFIKMIQAAYRFRHTHDIPSEMELVFDTNDNVNQLRLWIHGSIQTHSFEGNIQYIPPELMSRCAYQSDKVDVWVLGISLYRMLVGRYPFHADDDRRRLKKMHQADFSIPSHLSTDAKDLIRRMLAPDHARASLDLVIFHPWLKPYTTPPILTSPRVVPDDPCCPPLPIITKRRKSILTKAMVFMVDGPYPPPKQPYRALV